MNCSFSSGGQIHLKALVVKFQQLVQIARGSIVKIGSARGEAAQDRAFGAAHVAAEAADQAFAGIRGEDHVGLRRLRGILERIRASGDSIDRHDPATLSCESPLAMSGSFSAAGSWPVPISRAERQRVVADVRRVVAGGASSLRTARWVRWCRALWPARRYRSGRGRWKWSARGC